MPEGYERLRDALKRKGKSDEEAKSMAAAIWNKHHKDDPVTNKKHEFAQPSRREYLRDLKKTNFYKNVNSASNLAGAQLREEIGEIAKPAVRSRPGSTIGEMVMRIMKKTRPRNLEARLDVTEFREGNLDVLAKLLRKQGKSIEESAADYFPKLIKNKTKVKPKGWYPERSSDSQMSARLDILHEFGLARNVEREHLASLGDQLMAKVKGAARKDSAGRSIKAKKPPIGLSDIGLWPSGKPTFFFEQTKYGVVLLGIPENDIYAKAEQMLTDKLGRKIAKNSPFNPQQVKTALPVPIPKYRTDPSVNPNAPDPGPSLSDILEELMRQRKSMKSPLAA